jgi:chondroitin 4-sulfotransferase 11
MKLLINSLWNSLSKNEKNQLLRLLPILQQDAFLRFFTGKCDQYPPSFHSKKCIFVHIPKTAGTSVTDALFGTPRPRHRPLQWYEGMEPELYKEYFKFAFVRNPWDRLVSGYHYVVNKKPKKQSEIEWINFLRSLILLMTL